MQVTVNRQACIRCGLCPSLCPEVFTIYPGDAAQTRDPQVPDAYLISARCAADNCPTGAISVIG